MIKVFQQNILPVLANSNRQFYLTDQIMIHTFINKIGQSSIDRMSNIKTKN